MGPRPRCRGFQFLTFGKPIFFAVKKALLPRPARLLAFGLWLVSHGAVAQPAAPPDTLTFASGPLQLKGLLWKPTGTGPFPVVLFNHGGEPGGEFDRIVPVFLRRGYAFFALFRRGQYLSKGQGRYIVDVLDSANRAGGAEARSRLLMTLHETEQLADQLAGLRRLKAVAGIDTNRLAVMGISFGGIQTLLLAAQNVGVKAAVNFAGGAMNWDRSEALQTWMKTWAGRARIPIFFVQAENDFSTRPSRELAAELQHLNKPHQVKIYPPQGQTARQGHAFFDLGPDAWADDVFQFLDRYLTPR